MSKENAYIIDLGTGTNRNLLPLASGLIASYCKSQEEIRRRYNIQIRFLRESPQTMVAGFDSPTVLAFSCYVWNFQATLHLAQLAKKRFPKAALIFGGPSLPKSPEKLKLFFEKYPFIDIAVKGEGEYTFADLLLMLPLRKLSQVKGIVFRSSESPDGFVVTDQRERIADLNTIPSPFLDGTFDLLLEKYGAHVTGTVWETDRGCPFSCTFCDWGGADVNRISKFDSERLIDELKWMSRHKIFYIYGADANFGIFFERDLELAQKLSDLCSASGYPKFLMINWTKNSHERIVTIADCLRKGGVRTNVTLAMQSFHRDTLKAIKRVNIKPDSLLKLKEAFHDRHLPTYTELILGLPEETFSTFMAGIEQAMTLRLDDHFVIYLCTMLVNTEMDSDLYRKKYRFETRICSVGMSRRTFYSGNPLEVEEIVVGTSTLPLEDWQRAYLNGYFTVALYNFRSAFFVMNYLHLQFGVVRTQFVDFLVRELERNSFGYPALQQALKHIKKQRDMILDNASSISTVDGLGEVHLSPYEALLFIFLENIDQFYADLKMITEEFCAVSKINISKEIIDDLFFYQKIRMLVWASPPKKSYDFQTNIPEYFEAMTTGEKLPEILNQPMSVECVIPEQHFDNKIQFAINRVQSGHTVHVYKIKVKKTPALTSR